jgi:dihydrofolate synthase / folylpolyglutamate synthase
MSRTDAILKRLLALHPKLVDLKLDRQIGLLDRMGRPQDRLPPVIHVAGTNGKGSTIAYLRAFLEAAGKRVHVYNSPHLVRFNERIRLAGKLVGTRKLNAALEEADRINEGRLITFFEITSAAALQLFADTPADYLLLETGMGGTYDSTNIVDRPLGVIITPVDFDHQSFLGPTIASIAANKAGILKRGSPAVIGRQLDDGLAVIENRARELAINPFVAGRDYDGFAQNGRLVYQDDAGLLDLPPPALLGPHQFENAALAVAAVRHFNLPVNEAQLAEGLHKVDWLARLTPLRGKLREMLPDGHELWLDGGHNAHGAAALARAIEEMNRTRPAPLVMILGMMNTRPPADFLAPFAGRIAKLYTLTIPGEQNAHPAATIASAGNAAGIDTMAKRTIRQAVAASRETAGARVLICGSLYLAGHVLAADGTLPT